MKVYLRKMNYSLIAIDEESCDQLEKVASNDVVYCDIKQARNYENHKRFFAFLKVAFEMQDHFKEKEHFRRWLQMEAGYYFTIVCPNGDVKFVADSIAFENMEEPIFQALFSSAIDVFIRELGNGITEDELMQIIRLFIPVEKNRRKVRHKSRLKKRLSQLA